jgi:G3E family GTPase
MTDAIRDIRSRYAPSRIIVETSGSAFPAPIVMLLNTLPRGEVAIDGIITVIDALNFRGYEDTSYTARVQAQYTDLLLINKWEGMDERELEGVLDVVNDLNTDTPKLRWRADLPLGVFFGLSTPDTLRNDMHLVPDAAHAEREVELLELSLTTCPVSLLEMDALLAAIPREDEMYRIKGLLRPCEANAPYHILNWAFGGCGRILDVYLGM